MALKIKLSPNHIKFLRLLRKSRRDKHGKFCLSCYDKNWQHPCQLFSTNPYKLLQYADLSHNIYFSDNQFSKNKRSISSLEDLDEIFCDCDCIKAGITPQQFLKHFSQILQIAQLPEPCLKFSGHGFHLVYVISQIICRPKTKKGANLIQYWENTEEYTINKINQACLKIFHKSPVDLAVHDSSRVLRLADTNNVKSTPTRSYWISISNHIYQLKNFWAGKKQYSQLYNYYRHNFKQIKVYHQKNLFHKQYNHLNRKHSQTNQKYQELSHKYKGKALIKKNKQIGKARINWLINAFYKQKHQHLNGKRDLYLFILAREASKAYPHQFNKIINLLTYINNQIRPRPLEKIGLDKIIGEVTGNYVNAKINKYNYTTLFICKLLKIHPTYKETRKIHRQNNAMIHKQKLFHEDERMYKKIRVLQKQHETIAAIARRYNRSRHYIYNVIRRHKQYHMSKNQQVREIKKVSHQRPLVNTVESLMINLNLVFSFQFLSIIYSYCLDILKQCKDISRDNNYSDFEFNNSVPRISISGNSLNYDLKLINRYNHNIIDTKSFKDYESESLPVIIKQHEQREHYRLHRKRQYTTQQKRKYDTLIGNEEFGQQDLKTRRVLFKLKQWIINGKYKQLGVTKNQVRQFIQFFKR